VGAVRSLDRGFCRWSLSASAVTSVAAACRPVVPNTPGPTLRPPPNLGAFAVLVLRAFVRVVAGHLQPPPGTAHSRLLVTCTSLTELFLRRRLPGSTGDAPLGENDAPAPAPRIARPSRHFTMSSLASLPRLLFDSDRPQPHRGWCNAALEFSPFNWPNPVFVAYGSVYLILIVLVFLKPSMDSAQRLRWVMHLDNLHRQVLDPSDKCILFFPVCVRYLHSRPTLS